MGPGSTDRHSTIANEGAVTGSTHIEQPSRTDIADSTAGHIDFLQFALGEESNVAAIRRPEWIGGTFGAGERLRITALEWSQPQLRLTTLYRNDCKELAV